MTKENMKRKEVKKMTVKTVSAIVVAITLVFTVLIATKGVANDNVIVPEKKPATLNLKAKAETVQNWLASRPDAVSTWVEDAKEYQEQQWSEGKTQTTNNIKKLRHFFLGEE